MLPEAEALGLVMSSHGKVGEEELEVTEISHWDRRVIVFSTTQPSSLPLYGASLPLRYPNSKIKIECDFKETCPIFISRAFCPVE